MALWDALKEAYGLTSAAKALAGHAASKPSAANDTNIF